MKKTSNSKSMKQCGMNGPRGGRFGLLVGYLGFVSPGYTELSNFTSIHF